MNNDLSHYQQKLRHAEADLLDCFFDCWQLEQILFDNRKLYQKARELQDDEGDEIAEELNRQSRRLRKMLQSEHEQLDDLELDVEHYKFMITILQRDQ
jgi:hypothetical protein